MKRLYINPKYQKQLTDEGLDDFSALVAMAEKGDLVSVDVGRTTHKLQLGGHSYYLKSVSKPIIAGSVESVLTLRKPHHYCWRELKQVNALRALGLSVMEVAAAGESSSGAVLDFSFLLTPEVEGHSLEAVLEHAGPEEKVSLLAKLGSLVGRLHRSGFFSPVRTKDIIVDPDGQFVMIDRETRKPGPRRFSQRKVLGGLRKTQLRQGRDGHHWDEEQMQAYLAAYLAEAPPELNMTEAQLIDALDTR